MGWSLIGYSWICWTIVRVSNKRERDGSFFIFDHIILELIDQFLNFAILTCHFLHAWIPISQLSFAFIVWSSGHEMFFRHATGLIASRCSVFCFLINFFFLFGRFSAFRSKSCVFSAFNQPDTAGHPWAKCNAAFRFAVDSISKYFFFFLSLACVKIIKSSVCVCVSVRVPDHILIGYLNSQDILKSYLKLALRFCVQRIVHRVEWKRRKVWEMHIWTMFQWSSSQLWLWCEKIQ